MIFITEYESWTAAEWVLACALFVVFVALFALMVAKIRRSFKDNFKAESSR